MVDNTSTHTRKAGGVRFTADATDSLDNHEENPHKSTKLQWQECCDNNCSFELYFGILKLSHIYSMTLDVVFLQTPIQLETILDHQHTRGLQLSINQLPESHSKNQTSFEVELIIHPETIPGPFHRTFVLKEISTSQQRSVTVNVNGKILRQGQGTATLKHGVHMKSVITEEKDDEQ
ncbi:unnamed protein product [Adineta steineri]|uniref:Uncharacterized protein n=1 Tax=Adineta steineri TaxID=433720 RepID=A0A819HYI8_9BILA|nr:unnamed protein product [Adineta steineri]